MRDAVSGFVCRSGSRTYSTKLVSIFSTGSLPI
jgi:hypothetical protein